MIRALLIGILLLLIARAFWRLMDGVIEAAGGRSRVRGQAPPVKLVRDPVCGTFVPSHSALSVTSRGTTHYFCSEECRNKFQG